MEEAIHLIRQEIERQTIFLKIEKDLEFIVVIAGKIERLKNAAKILLIYK